MQASIPSEQKKTQRSVNEKTLYVFHVSFVFRKKIEKKKIQFQMT